MGELVVVLALIAPWAVFSELFIIGAHGVRNVHDDPHAELRLLKLSFHKDLSHSVNNYIRSLSVLPDIYSHLTIHKYNTSQAASQHSLPLVLLPTRLTHTRSPSLHHALQEHLPGRGPHGHDGPRRRRVRH